MRRLTLASLVLATACAVVFAATALATKKQSGHFTTLQAGSDAGLHLSGKAELKRKKHGTDVRIEVKGLKPQTTYAAHLHNDVCAAANPGGTHYQNVPGGPAEPPNELWLSSDNHDPKAGITSNKHGVAHGKGKADWVARADAKSVIIHMIPPGGTTAGGPKIACADLIQN